jgi:hypothetical protein
MRRLQAPGAGGSHRPQGYPQETFQSPTVDRQDIPN